MLIGLDRYGIFRLIEPRGLKEVLVCKKQGFHPDHDRVYTVSRDLHASVTVLADRLPSLTLLGHQGLGGAGPGCARAGRSVGDY
jgi:hypothetical protein